MEASFETALRNMEVDIPTTLGRLMNNEEIYKKFVLRYADDRNFIDGKRFYIERNYGEMERCFHTMKGVTATLGIMMISSRADAVVHAIRNQDYELIPPMISELEEVQVFCLRQISTIKQ